MEVGSAPKGLEKEFEELVTPEASLFLEELISTFQFRVAEILRIRKLRKLLIDTEGRLPKFEKQLPEIANPNWKVWPLPAKIQNRHLDLGDVAPSDREHLRKALQSQVQGIQVDFDDGSCPSWRNTILGIHNVVSFVQGSFFPGELPSVVDAPILMLRPRAWNMNEHNILVCGKETPGPLVDFGLLMFHVGKTLAANGVGPFFYLSKVEGANEAVLWNDIFCWTQERLGLTRGTIKACVLIENILASFEMEEILFALREHSLGLNCGIWDYCASFVNKFGDRREFLLPDRNKYVNMEKHFLASYMKLVVQTCHKRGAMATGGMAALTLKNAASEEEKLRIVEGVCKAKLREIHAGVDGFMVYDTDLVPWVNEMWNKFGSHPNQIERVKHENLCISEKDLLLIPQGGVTMTGLRHNIKVGILFINCWLKDGRGHFILDGAVEDSATAEISRSQIWQWIYHMAKLEDGTREVITKALTTNIAMELMESLRRQVNCPEEVEILNMSCDIFLEIVTSFDFPEFITTYLYNHSLFRKLQES